MYFWRKRPGLGDPSAEHAGEGTLRRNVRTGLAIPHGEVARNDVAALLLEVIECSAVGPVIIESTRGGTQVVESVERLAGA